jgi:hypothetical protein
VADAVGSGLALYLAEDEEKAMPYLVRKSISAVPQVPVKVLLSAATLTSFGWLLAHGLVHPIVIYALQLYLSF